MAPRFQEAERNDPFRNFNFRIVMGGERGRRLPQDVRLDGSVNTVKFRAGNNKASNEELLPGRTDYKPVTLRGRA